MIISNSKGNLTEYEINAKEYEVDYDLDNRIIKVGVSQSGSDDVEYRYDALGRRVIRQEGTTKTALIWWGNSENAEHKHQAGQTVIQNDIMAHPSRLNSVIARAVDGSKFKLEWYHKNYLDHVYAVSDDSGDILEHYRYTAFGEKYRRLVGILDLESEANVARRVSSREAAANQVQIYNASGNQVATTQIDNHILWNTRRRDALTGYYLYKYRHYSAELGRWLARDPIEERGGVNLYAFVGNDGINWLDILGLCTEEKKIKKFVSGGKIIVFYYGDSEGDVVFNQVSGKELKKAAESIALTNYKKIYDKKQKLLPNNAINISSDQDIQDYFNENMEALKSNGIKHIVYLDHGSEGKQNTGLFDGLSSESIKLSVEATSNNGLFLLAGCNVAAGDTGNKYLSDISKKYPKCKFIAADTEVMYSFIHVAPFILYEDYLKGKRFWLYQNGSRKGLRLLQPITPHRKLGKKITIKDMEKVENAK